MVTALTVLAGIGVVFAITVLTGYFVAQEFAYMAVDRSRLKARADAGDTASARALAVTRRTSFMLSGAQLGITVTGLLVGYVAEPLIGRGLGELLGGVGIPTAVGIGIGAVLAILFSTFVQMVFGELFPKNLAIARPEPVARRLAFSTTLYLRLFGWLIWLFDQASNQLLRVLRIEPVHDVEHSANPRDLAHIVAESRHNGELPRDLSILLDRILDFPTRTAEHAMIPRPRVDTVGVGESVTAVLARMGAGHTRYPVVGDTVDDLLGVIHLHDLLADDVHGTVESHTRTAVVVPSTLPLPEVLGRLVEAGDELALVVDEYGGFAGMVTIEDMAEELVGELADEHDPAVVTGVVRAEGGWLIPGDLHIDEVERILDHRLPAGGYETLAGLVIAEFGGLPEVGDTVTVSLPPDAADLISDEEPTVRVAAMQVRGVEKHVPASVFVTVSGRADDVAEAAHG
ncbi:HlyC/CorC family transporter [Antrihabitans sp. YC3-6]|uniref:HlyC/CorC family transporter n=1 Tax=Antrihabitans stalagmiti TaxID=2799499 RepID=A0A934NQG3_9NOCA|nr:hemolysin family protein [Antrihabitans stalagmiti]MBJ8339397.1 HlyC/CorC family transporter [Antrihabitans stalagmiti]